MKNNKIKSLYSKPVNSRLRKFLYRNKNVSNAEVDQIAKDLGFRAKHNLLDKYDQSKVEKYAHEIASLIIGIIIFILVFGTKCSAQNDKSDIKHFYAIQAISHTANDVYIWIKPESHLKAFFVGLLTGIAAGECKEFIYDKYFGFGVYSVNDRIVNYWSSACYMPIRIVLNDIKKNKEINQQIKINEYEQQN